SSSCLPRIWNRGYANSADGRIGRRGGHRGRNGEREASYRSLRETRIRRRGQAVSWRDAEWAYRSHERNAATRSPRIEMARNLTAGTTAVSREVVAPASGRKPGTVLVDRRVHEMGSPAVPCDPSRPHAAWPLHYSSDEESSP